MSQRDNKIRNVLERYAQYYPALRQCRSFQINKRHSQKYGHVPPTLVITTTWRVLYVDLIGSYTLKGKDCSSIDFMCLTKIDPATSWFEIVELPTVTKLTVPTKVLDISFHLGKRSYLPWEWEFPHRHIPPTLAATWGLDLLPLAIALIGAHRDV
jgi:hypothetical protein